MEKTEWVLGSGKGRSRETYDMGAAWMQMAE